jgi:environmental stress-induced protein Ves
MPLALLRNGTYDRKPWKNGGGITEDVWLHPHGSSHDDFDIRLSLAEISQEGPFSAFPGIDRTITLVGGDPLVLEFNDGTRRHMTLLDPFSFDGVMTPVSRLDGAPSRDFNVMTRRGRWSHRVAVHRNGGRIKLELDPGDVAVLHAVTGSWRAGADGRMAEAAPRDTVIVQGETGLIVEGEPGSEAIVAILSPAR